MWSNTKKFSSIATMESNRNSNLWLNDRGKEHHLLSWRWKLPSMCFTFYFGTFVFFNSEHSGRGKKVYVHHLFS